MKRACRRAEEALVSHRSEHRTTVLVIALIALTGAVVVLGPDLAQTSDSTSDSVVTRVEPTTSMPVGVTFGNSLQHLSPRALDQALDELVSMHATWIRMDMAWSDLQTVGPDLYSWAATDRVVRAARDRGLDVLGLLTYTPPWARSPGCEGIACPPASVSAFTTYAMAVARRYREEGVRTFEIWNEPNLPLFWRHPDPVAYRNLLIRTTAALKEQDPDVRVLFGGLAALPTSGDTIGASQFVTETCSTGLCSTIDAVSYHPYTFPQLASSLSHPLSAWARMADADRTAPSLMQAMDQSGLAGKLIWVTEYGAPTSGAATTDLNSGNPAVTVSPERQAEILVDGLRSAIRERSFVGSYFVHTWQDQRTNGSTEDGFGIRDVGGGPKPAYTALLHALADLAN
jgi:hypothetical protein